jgi:RNA binding exosome subunit
MGLRNLTFRAFIHATEDPEKAQAALRFVSGHSEVRESGSEGVHGNPITVIESTITKAREIDAVMRRFTRDDLTILLDSLTRRIDEQGDFYFRLRKQDAFEGRFSLADGEEPEGDIISVRGRIEAYPKKKETIMASILEYLNDLLSEAPQ